jgi:hypothetical protein
VTSGDLVEFRDSDGLTIGTVAAGSGAGFTGATGITSNGGNVNLRTGPSLTVTQAIYAGTGDIRLVAGAAIPRAPAGPSLQTGWVSRPAVPQDRRCRAAQRRRPLILLNVKRPRAPSWKLLPKLTR